MVPLSAKVWYNKLCSLDFQFQQSSAAVLPEAKKSNDRELITFNTSIIPLDGLMAKYERAAVGCINHEVFNNSGLPQTLFAISDSNKTGCDGLSTFAKYPLNKDATPIAKAPLFQVTPNEPTFGFTFPARISAPLLLSDFQGGRGDTNHRRASSKKKPLPQHSLG